MYSGMMKTTSKIVPILMLAKLTHIPGLPYLPPDLFTIHRGTTNIMHHQAGRYVVLLLIPLTGSNIDLSGSYLYIPAQPLFR